MPGVGLATSGVPLPGPVLPLSEVFGPTWQGEGPHTGRVTAFVRLGLCNLSCEWCDTPYTWDTTRYDVAAECPDTPIDTIHDRLWEIDVPMVTVSGGEPLVHHKTLPYLMTPEWEWQVETNGTIPPPTWWHDAVSHTTISPKINTRDPQKKRLKSKALQGWTELAEAGKASFKFVVTNPKQDFHTIESLAMVFGIPRDRIWVMPEGTTPVAVLEHHRAMAEAALAHGFNTTTRLHTLLWGQERGR
jgi:organic radical activating enzyme